ncbi:hypothetical protein DCAR_0728295 [Daucus carota subsp. sativus]|uniref:Uncharacterized protein n=1 Tax=Daucus carota subsp. sativus TaxID=79200 RepID=A0A164TGL0_DAUCS|nr:PREDICTED: uncharacterized protein LOC108193622 isoform X2 [Daucus carota subsp. sativus]WOH08845.1 hypothetical protein DCAR_0728295 [Daucus carota subsp. sativus]
MSTDQRRRRKVVPGINGIVPKFIKVIYGPDTLIVSLRLPERFLDAVGGRLPNNVVLQYPNGREIHVHYQRINQSLVDLDPLFNELEGEEGFYLLFEYNGNGLFSLSVIDKALTEVEYQHSRKIPRAPVLYQDKVNGKRWKFMARALGQTFENGSVEILWLLLILVGGVSQWIFMITVRQKIMTFNEPIIIDSDSEYDLGELEEAEMAAQIQEGIVGDAGMDMEGNAPQGEVGQNGDNIENNDQIRQFTKVLTQSNTDQSSHGVIIPFSVKPRNRGWKAGEQVSLITGLGSWTCTLEMHHKCARFSGGWNNFSLENDLEKDQVLRFNLVEAENSIVFHVN